MHQPVMVTTKLHEIGKTGLTALTPVLDVVPIDIMFECAARELAAFISRFQGSAHCRRDNPRFSANIEWCAVFVFSKYAYSGIAT
jgi:hypothetical protein